MADCLKHPEYGPIKMVDDGFYADHRLYCRVCMHLENEDPVKQDGCGMEGDDCCRVALQAIVAGQASRIRELETWVNDLQTGLYINCVYCGHRYGPGEQEVPAAALTAHVMACPKHPLAQAQAALKAADRLASSKGHAERCTFTACNCGAVEAQKTALSDYWKARRVNQ